jgi:ABC-type multidrug transport system fused ATPase/permease subunit
LADRDPTVLDSGLIRKLLRPHSRLVIGVLLLSVLAALGEALGLALVSLLLNQLLGSRGTLPTSRLFEDLSTRVQSNPGAFFALLALTYVGRSIITLVANYSSIAVALRISDQWRMRLFGAILRTPLTGPPAKQGVLVQTVLDEPSVAAQGMSAAGIMVQAMVSALTVYVTLLWLSPSVGLALTVIAALAMGVLTALFRRSRKIAEQRSQIFREGYGYVTEMLGSVRQIRLFGLEQGVERRVEGLISRMRVVSRTSGTLASSPRVLIEIVFVIAFALMLAFLAPRIGQAEIMAAAGLAGVAAMRVLPSFSSAAGTWVQVQRAIYAIRRIGAELERMEGAIPEPGKTSAPPFTREIQISDVQFAYPQRAWALKGVDLRIPVGSFVALVGPSGSGKSTLLDLLCGLHDPDQGAIVVDGVDLRSVSKASWRLQLGVVPQDGFLLSGTLRDNLCLLRPDCPEELMREMVALVGAERIVAELPSGYDTVVGERGVTLSGGQRQRLALARVLIREPRLLLLDEATSALDAESDDQIFRALEQRYRGRMTIVAIAHRLASIQRADSIHVLKGGRLVESGDHASLLRAGGVYAALYRTVHESPHVPAELASVDLNR